jgi:hypothetical protein
MLPKGLHIERTFDYDAEHPLMPNVCPAKRLTLRHHIPGPVGFAMTLDQSSCATDERRWLDP